jgi:hypothetical protein
VKLVDLKTRVYEILGDDPIVPRWFPFAQILHYMNRGCQIFRREVCDEWYRVDVPVVAGQAIYDFPEDSVRAERVAFDDTTCAASTVTALQGWDSRWEQTDSVAPFAWTSDGLPHNQFRLYPKPTTDSASNLVWSGETGIVVAVEDDSGFATTSSETGLLLAMTGASITGETGEVQAGTSTGGGGCTLWLVKRPAGMASDDDEIPIAKAYHLAPLWYALEQTYLEEADHHNSDLASFYGGLFRQYVARAIKRYKNPAPRMIHRRRPVTSPLGDPASELRFSSTVMINGSPVNVRW